MELCGIGMLVRHFTQHARRWRTTAGWRNMWTRAAAGGIRVSYDPRRRSRVPPRSARIRTAAPLPIGKIDVPVWRPGAAARRAPGRAPRPDTGFARSHRFSGVSGGLSPHQAMQQEHVEETHRHVSMPRRPDRSTSGRGLRRIRPRARSTHARGVRPGEFAVSAGSSRRIRSRSAARSSRAGDSRRPVAHADSVVLGG